MTQAFRCDLCGECVVSEGNAQSSREVARQPTNINGVGVDIGIIVQAHKQHVCNSCWAKVMQKVKAWVDANLGT